MTAAPASVLIDSPESVSHALRMKSMPSIFSLRTNRAVQWPFSSSDQLGGAPMGVGSAPDIFRALMAGLYPCAAATSTPLVLRLFLCGQARGDHQADDPLGVPRRHHQNHGGRAILGQIGRASCRESVCPYV